MARRKQRKLGATPTCKKVTAGSGVQDWKGVLTAEQCARFPTGLWIGRGSFASAYLHGDEAGKVVKFTADPQDAKAARALLGKSVPGVVKVYDVAELKGQMATAPVLTAEGVFEGDEAVVPVYAIVTEYVQKGLPSGYQYAHRAVTEWIDGRRHLLIHEKLGKDFKFSPGLLETADKSCEFRGRNRQEPDVEGCKKKARKLVRAIEGAAHNGALVFDLHAGNWGHRGLPEDDEPVLLDFGVSAIEEAGPIDLAKAPKPRRKVRRRRSR